MVWSDVCEVFRSDSEDDVYLLRFDKRRSRFKSQDPLGQSRPQAGHGESPQAR